MNILKLSNNDDVVSKISNILYKNKGNNIANIINNEVYDIFFEALKDDDTLTDVERLMLQRTPVAFAYSCMFTWYSEAKKEGRSFKGCAKKLIEGFEYSYESALKTFELICYEDCLTY